MQGLGRGWDLYNGEQIQRLQESCRHTGIPGCSCRLDWTLTGTVVLWALWRKGQRKRSWKENCFPECSDIINKGYLEITISPLSKSQSASSFFFKVYMEHVVDLWLIACLLWTDAFFHLCIFLTANPCTFQNSYSAFIQLMPVFIIIIVSVITQLMATNPPYSLFYKS